MIKIELFLVAIIAVLGLGIYAAQHQQTSHLGFAPAITAATTNASTSISTAAVQILAANSSALFRSICDPNVATGTLYLWLNSTSTGFSGASGIAIGPNQCLQLSEQLGDMWLGTIYGVMSNGTTTITYHEQ